MVVGTESVCGWPVTAKGEWCGEWKRHWFDRDKQAAARAAREKG